jgi:hypothetical protein
VSREGSSCPRTTIRTSPWLRRRYTHPASVTSRPPTLHGMEQAHGTSYTPNGVLRGTYALVRYADDLAVFSPIKEEAVEAQRRLSAWLGTRGWRGSDEKTHIHHLREGFNCLGLTVRPYPTPQSSRSGCKLLITPRQASLQQMKWKKASGASMRSRLPWP